MQLIDNAVCMYLVTQHVLFIDRDHVDLKLDLLEEYKTPPPFPKDEFKRLDIPTDQAYVMFSTAKTGKCTCLRSSKWFCLLISLIFCKCRNRNAC